MPGPTTNTRAGPRPVPPGERETALDLLTGKERHALAELVHDGWWQEKMDAGFHHPATMHPEWDASAGALPCEKCHLDMVPYAALPPDKQQVDFTTIGTTIAGLRRLGFTITPPGRDRTPGK